MKLYSQSDIGLRRNSNQDYCMTGYFPDGSAWAIVCDGMGGANGGSTASRVATETIAETLSGGYRENMERQEIGSLMKLAIEYANKAVYEMSQHIQGLDGMGTTVVCAIAKDNWLHVVHAGDSRAYLCTNDSVRQITTDHSIVQELVQAGTITPEEARIHPNRNLITRALGTEPVLRTDYNTVEFKNGAKVILCTDGLSNYITDKGLLDFIRNNQCDKLTDMLIEKAKELGGSDNITVAIISSEEG